MTRPSSEPYYRRHRPPQSICSGKLTSTSPSTNELKTSSKEQHLHRRHRDATRTNNPTSVGRRGPVKKSTPPGHPPLALEEHPMEVNARWTTSSTPSARTTRTCATPSRITGTSNTLSGTTDRFNRCHRPHLEEHLENLDNLNNQKEEETEHSRASTGKSTSSSTDTGRRKASGNRSSTTGRYWWQPPVHMPRTSGSST
jgi:hypothetical protein